MSKAKEHGALLFNMVKLSKQIFPKYNDEIYRILNKTDEVAKYADMADTLEGATPSEITEESLNLLAGHVANKNNPHEETPESTNTFSAESVIDMFKNKVEVGLSPFDVYGYNLKTWTKLNVNDLFSLSGSKVTVSTHQAIMNGVRYDVVTGVTDLATLASTWNNKTWYVFLRMVEGVATIEFSDEYSAESLVKAYVGSIHTGTGTKSLNPFVRLDTFRLSTNPLGSGIAVGLEGFDSSKGIHLGWRPSTNTLRPERPPKVDIWLINYDKSSNGTSGYIDTASYQGNPLLQVNQGVAPNINFGIEGDGVTVTASFQNLGGANPTVTKVSNTQFRVSANSYSLSKVTFTAKNKYGDEEYLHMFFEIRTNLTIKYGSATNSISTGTQGGLTLVSYRIDTDGQLHLALTGDGVTTSVTRANTSGSGATVTRVNNTRYDISSSKDNVMLLTFTAKDKYGRTASFSMYVNVINVFIFINDSTLSSIELSIKFDNPGIKAHHIFINNGTVIGNRNTNYSLDTGVYPSGSTLEIINNGKIIGRGGDGSSHGNDNPQSGGDAINIRWISNIINNGYIFGGGGGGGYRSLIWADGNSRGRAGGGGGAGLPGGRPGSTDARVYIGVYSYATAGSEYNPGSGGRVRHQDGGILSAGRGGELGSRGEGHYYRSGSGWSYYYYYGDGGNGGYSIRKNNIPLTLSGRIGSEYIKGINK